MVLVKYGLLVCGTAIMVFKNIINSRTYKMDRIKKINELIKHKIAEILLREGIFGKDVLVTVQSVGTSKDLKYAKIKISIIPFEKSEKVLQKINNQISHIRKKLGEEIKIKFIPKIIFEIDKGEERADRIDRILKEI